MTRGRLLAAWLRFVEVFIGSLVVVGMLLALVAGVGYAARILWHALEWGLRGLPL